MKVCAGVRGNVTQTRALVSRWSRTACCLDKVIRKAEISIHAKPGVLLLQGIGIKSAYSCRQIEKCACGV